MKMVNIIKRLLPIKEEDETSIELLRKFTCLTSSVSEFIFPKQNKIFSTTVNDN